MSGSSASTIAASVEAGVASGALAGGRDAAVGPGARPGARRQPDHGGRRAGRPAPSRRRRLAAAERHACGRTAAARRQVAAVPTDARDLATGSPDPALLPSLPALAAPRSGSTAGRPRLCLSSPRSLATGVRRRRRSRVTRVAAVNGALDGIERVLAAHLAPGDVVAVEDPGLAGRVRRRAGCSDYGSSGASNDERGMLPDALRPLCVSCPAARRRDPARAQPVRKMPSSPPAPRDLAAALPRRRAG